MEQEYPKAKNPLILRYHRLLEAFSKSDDERDFYLDRIEGFLLYLDLDKGEEELVMAEKEFKKSPDRYCLVPKLTYYETKKFMEGFVNEKVYDIDTKEKLLDIISSKEARENFLEFIYDHLSELDKWQQYYNERSRVRIIEWLRKWNISFVFEEDLELPKQVVERLKEHTFDAKVNKELQQARETLEAKGRVYYSNEALNPRPKRGRPPKQQAKIELEPQLTDDMYTTIPLTVRHFLFAPDYSSNAVTFSTKFESEEQLLANLKGSVKGKVDSKLEILSQRLESLRQMSDRLKDFQTGGSAQDSRDQKLKGAFLPADEEGLEEDDQPKLSRLVKEVLPSQKKEKSTKSEMKELLEEKKKKGMKQVTQIKYKTDKKK
jgi:hypothetical protein